MTTRNLILVFGDQLSRHNPVLEGINARQAVVLMAEVAEEAPYVAHNRDKIVLIFSAMCHFAVELKAEGIRVRYVAFEDGCEALALACRDAIEIYLPERLVCCAPREYRLMEAMQAWQCKWGDRR